MRVCFYDSEQSGRPVLKEVQDMSFRPNPGDWVSIDGKLYIVDGTSSSIFEIGTEQAYKGVTTLWVPVREPSRKVRKS